VRRRKGATRAEVERQLADAHRRIAELERELEVRALRDPVTGLPTLQAFDRRLDIEIDRAQRHARKLAVAVLDVDGFGAINGAHGRHAGDEVLAAVGKALERHTRASDFLARTSADEFVIGLPETGAVDAVQAFERLRLELESLRVGPVDCVSVSVGVADFARGMGGEELVAQAAETMRIARTAGGGRTEVCATGAVHNATGDERRTQQGAVSGLAEVLSERDRYTGQHSEEVLDLVEQVARVLIVDEHEVQRVRYAALLHDIGKVGIPDEILQKEGALDDDEWQSMRQHPVIGERILRAIPGLGSVARIVRHEHERFDGSGYPDGLSGEEIPIGARIILACDAYNAMISDRPYRKALTHALAIRELAKNAGTQFDPEVTEVLIGCLYGRRQSGAAAATSTSA
jgi:diguanylate cyclase (GGDEF)-like protein/putative nucleotidyltransferase with HDIG domain